MCKPYRVIVVIGAFLISSLMPDTTAARTAVGPFMKRSGANAGKTVVEPDPVSIAQLRKGEKELDLKGVPLADGDQADFQVERFNVFSVDSQIVSFDGISSSPITVPPILTYRGRNVADPTQVIFISVNEDEDVHMAVADSKKLTLMTPESKSKTKGPKRHLLSKGDAADLATFRCALEALPENQATVQNEAVAPAIGATEFAAAPTIREAKVLMDVSHSLYTQRFGSSQSAARDYVANLVGAVSIIYQRDLQVAITVKDLVIWTSQDPFGTLSTKSQLEKYKSYNVANRMDTGRDATHLLSYASGLGGVAYIDGLCDRSYDCGVSNLDADAVFPVTSYHWDVYVVAHELGHTFGSPHTHCYDPPIDCCYNESRGCDMCSSVGPDLGTIMSYCHLNGSVTLNFHPRCITVMQNTISRTDCIGTYVGPITPDPEVQLTCDLTGTWGTGLTDSPVQRTKLGKTGTTYQLKAKLYVRNNGQTPNAATDTVDLYLSDDAVLGPEDTLVSTRLTGIVKVPIAGKPQKIKKFALKKTLYQNASGKYLIALLNSPCDLNFANNGLVSTRIP